MQPSEFVKEVLHLDKEGVETDDGAYVVTLSGSNEFSKLYSLLDKKADADLDQQAVMMTEDVTILVYLTDDFDITLKADMKNKRYTLTVERAEPDYV